MRHRKSRNTTRCSALVFVVCLFSNLLIVTPVMADSTAQVAQINGYLKRAEDNLKLVQSSVGASGNAPSGSQGRLARMRLDQALADITPLADALAMLPATDAGVAEAQARYEAALSQANALDAILAGAAAEEAGAPTAATSDPSSTTPEAVLAPSVAAPAATDSTAPVEGLAPLDYRQQEVLKGAEFNLQEVQGSVAALTQLVSELQLLEDQLGIDYRRVQTGLDTIENTRRKAEFTQDALNQLPPDSQGVGELLESLAAANAELDAAAAYLAPLGEELATLIDPANYPELEADRVRLGDLANLFQDASVLQNDPLRAASVLEEADAAQAEATRIAETYARLIEQETAEGQAIENAGNHFQQTFSAFRAAADREKEALPGKIRADLAEANDQAVQAVENQEPAWFIAGIPQTMGYARDRLSLFKLLDPMAAEGLQAEFDRMQEDLDQRGNSLKDLIVRQNPLPPDRYAGGDREKLVAVAVDALKKQQPQVELLAARIPSETWSRETKISWGGDSWTLVDRSKVQVQLIVTAEKNAKLAIIRPVDIWMDHQRGDALTGTPLFGADEELQPASYMLREKIQ